MAIGAHGNGSLSIDSGRAWKQEQDGPSDVLSKIYDKFIDVLNDGDVDGAYKFLFREDNRCIYADGGSLNDRDTTIAGVKASNITMKSATPIDVYAESSNLWHEIGNSIYVLNGA